MTRRIVLTPEALSDIVEIAAYIARHDPAAADRLLIRLETKTRLLSPNPQLGRPYGLRPGIRLSSSGNYLIAYRLLEDGIEVLRYLHTRRDVSRLLKP